MDGGGGWDPGRVYAVPQGLNVGQQYEREDGLLTPAQARVETAQFIRNFQSEGVYVYRDQLMKNASRGVFHVEMDLEQLKTDRESLHDAVTKRPAEFLPFMEQGARDVLVRYRMDISVNGVTLQEADIPPVQVTFIGQLVPTPIRSITAAEMNRLLLVPGIVISAARTRPRGTVLTARCKTCGHEVTLHVSAGADGAPLPGTCKGQGANDANGGNPPADAAGAKCPRNPYIVVPDRCSFVDAQRLKLQEAPETVPTGEMPRTVEVVVDRVYADRIAPGTRVRFLGVASISKGPDSGARGAAVAVRVPFLRAVGVVSEEAGAGRNAITTFTTEEEARIKALAADPDIFARLSASVAPSIAGDYTEDIKKAILCLLLGGRWKRLQDGGRLRGDINVLLLGDPSTAKSQFLKFVERVAPVGVYTSGKGSSAAGLTASVIRDNRGEFHLEGGAMVLADGGVVCIDEFDKMREEDRVAIHEAMEQQTISVAKAGITTILNSRCSVLAAANPVYGRYDDSKSIADNIDLLPTILSRFDLLFIVRDTRDDERDRAIARHVIGVHVHALDTAAAGTRYGEGEGEEATGGAGAGAGAGTGPFGAPGAGKEVDLPLMKKFVAYARTRCAPVLTSEAAELLAGEYADIRQAAEGAAKAREAASAGKEGTNVGSVIPITVRQLEALVRVTEAVAKASLSPVATPEHVKEALALFKKSTLAAAQKGLGTGEVLTPEARARVLQVENRIMRALAPGETLPVAHLKSLLRGQGFDDAVINNALRIMDSREEVRLVNERRDVRRVK